jgi:hypothetical protein
MSFYVKHMHLNNAAGHVAPPVYIVADKSLGADDFNERKGWVSYGPKCVRKTG